MRLLLLVALVFVDGGAEQRSRRRGPTYIVGVNVSLKPNAVTLSQKQVRRGYYVQFKVRNTTASTSRVHTRRAHDRGSAAEVPVPRDQLRRPREVPLREPRAPSGDAIRGMFVVS